MSTTRIGKIGRLPLGIRNELNRRLQDGEPGNTLVGWLNAQEKTREIMGAQFGGRPITEQNVSDWKSGGYEDWLRHQAALESVGSLLERAGELDAAAHGEKLGEQFARILAVELTRLAEVLLTAEAEPDKQWARFQAVAREVSRLRRDDHRAVQTEMARERHHRQVKQEDAAAQRKAETERAYQAAIAPIYADLNRELAGHSGQPSAPPDHPARRPLPALSASLAELEQSIIALRDGGRGPASRRTRKNSKESSPIQPNRTKNNSPANPGEPALNGTNPGTT